MSKLISNSQWKVSCKHVRSLTKDGNKVLHRVGCINSSSLQTKLLQMRADNVDEFRELGKVVLIDVIGSVDRKYPCFGRRRSSSGRWVDSLTPDISEIPIFTGSPLGSTGRTDG